MKTEWRDYGKLDFPMIELGPLKMPTTPKLQTIIEAAVRDFFERKELGIPFFGFDYGYRRSRTVLTVMLPPDRFVLASRELEEGEEWELMPPDISWPLATYNPGGPYFTPEYFDKIRDSLTQTNE